MINIATIGAKIIDKVADFFPTPEQKNQAKIALLEMEQKGELGLIEQQLSAIITEAQSNDSWTSRARPSFLYVVYLVILAGIPMGVLFAFKPEVAQAVTTGFQAWLAAIPEEMWWLFGTGYLGYTGARSFDKGKKQ